MNQPADSPQRENHLLIISLSRSGGKLLRMLLDGHTGLNVFPFEHWHRETKKRFPARRIQRFASLSVDDRLATAGAAHLERKLRALHPEPLVTEILGRWRTDAERASTLAELYGTLARRYFAATGSDPSHPAVNHCGGLCRLTHAQLDAVFGEGTHLLTIRDPRAVFTSMEALRHQKFTIERIRSGRVSAGSTERHLAAMETVNGVSPYLREFCQDYRRMVVEHAARPGVVRVRFEDLVTTPEIATREICARLGIDWEPILLKPTQFTAGRSANSSYDREGDVVHPQAATDWVSRISASTSAYIENTLAEEMDALGYRPLTDQCAPAR